MIPPDDEESLFIQYQQAICLPVNIDYTKVIDMVIANVLITVRLTYRKMAEKIR